MKTVTVTSVGSQTFGTLLGEAEDPRHPAELQAPWSTATCTGVCVHTTIKSELASASSGSSRARPLGGTWSWVSQCKGLVLAPLISDTAAAR